MFGKAQRIEQGTVGDTFGNGTEPVAIGLALDVDILFGGGERLRGASIFGRWRR